MNRIRYSDTDTFCFNSISWSSNVLILSRFLYDYASTFKNWLTFVIIAFVASIYALIDIFSNRAIIYDFIRR
jgi:hypothetical protein